MTAPLDEARLRELAEAASRVQRDAIGRIDGKDTHRIWFAHIDAVSPPATILALLDALSAERERGDRAVGLLRRVASDPSSAGLVVAAFLKGEASVG